MASAPGTVWARHGPSTVSTSVSEHGGRERAPLTFRSVPGDRAAGASRHRPEGGRVPCNSWPWELSDNRSPANGAARGSGTGAPVALGRGRGWRHLRAGRNPRGAHTAPWGDDGMLLRYRMVIMCTRRRLCLSCPLTFCRPSLEMPARSRDSGSRVREDSRASVGHGGASSHLGLGASPRGFFR
jgi:hypothetical protein